MQPVAILHRGGQGAAQGTGGSGEWGTLSQYDKVQVESSVGDNNALRSLRASSTKLA